MLIALTGTPGVGKSTIASMLSSRGHDVVELSHLIEDRDLLGEFDQERETFEVDIDLLDQAVLEFGEDHTTILVGHLSHLLSVELAIILRCRPSILRTRLSGRGWSEPKVRENMEAEACDVILIEALEACQEVCEIDTTSSPPELVVESVEEILLGEREKYAPGNIDWSEEVLGWF